MENDDKLHKRRPKIQLCQNGIIPFYLKLIRDFSHTISYVELHPVSVSRKQYRILLGLDPDK